MQERQANKIRVRFYEVQQKYTLLARELHRILDGDTTFPSDSVYTVKHRLKNPQRLLEKIDHVNSKLRKGANPIDHENFQKRVDDILGMRIVCLRLSDLEKLKQYLASLAEEDRLKFVKGPTEKKTFLIRLGTTESPKSTTDMQYSGYSSIHYVVKLGKLLRTSRDLSALKAELQLRTIFEETWGEIDHKYRYELVRVGKAVPSHIKSGFRDLGLYLQAAARQADHLCEEVEKASSAGPSKKAKRSKAHRVKKVATLETTRKAVPQTLAEVFEDRVGFTPTSRTLLYCQRRLDDYTFHMQQDTSLADLMEWLNTDVMRRFSKIYNEISNIEPFKDQSPSEKDLDVVNLFNFVIFSQVEAIQSAEAGLKAALRGRF